MTMLHLFAYHPRRRTCGGGRLRALGARILGCASRARASDLRSRCLSWNQSEPLKLRAGFILIGLGLVLSAGAVLESTSAGADGAIALVLCADALFVLGGLWLLFALGQRLASRLRRERKRCGCCRFYEVESGLYVIGRCQADPSRHAVSRADSCSRFCFSERAMVCDRLAQHPRMLQQLQIIGSSDAANQS